MSQSETEVVLKNEKNELIRIPADEVEQLAPSQKSLMPELLLKCEARGHPSCEPRQK